MKNKLKELNRNIEIIFINSKDQNCTKNNWLPGGTITAIWGKIVAIINKESIVINRLGK